MHTFYVNVQVHGGIEIEAETEAEAESKAREFQSHENLSDVFHVDTYSVDHEDYCTCPDCFDEEEE